LGARRGFGLNIDGRWQIRQVVIRLGRIKIHMSKIIFFSTLDHRNVDCLDKGRGLDTSFRNSRCHQTCPVHGWRPLNGNGHRWTWRAKFSAEIRSDFSRFSHGSGRPWKSLNILGWWAV
jgi:hypothetical protein